MGRGTYTGIRNFLKRLCNEEGDMMLASLQEGINLDLKTMDLMVIEALAQERQDEVVYMLAHAGREPGCKNAHPTWEEEIRKMYRFYHEQGAF